MINLNTTLKRFLCFCITSLFLVILTLSFFVSIQSITNESSLTEAHSLFLVSHLDYYHNLNQHDDSEDTKDLDHHSHTHKHSENGEEHSHEHLNTIVISDFVIFQSFILITHTSDLKSRITNSYNPIISDPFVLKILRPPILA